MDISRFATKRNLIIAAGVALFLVIIWAIVLLMPRTEYVQKQFSVKPLPMRAPMGVYAAADALYFENGRSLVRYAGSSVDRISPEYELPDIDGLFVGKDPNKIIFQSVAYTPTDITASVRDAKKLDNDTDYWWSLNLSNGSLRLLTENDQPLRFRATQFDPQRNQFYGISITRAEDLTPQYLYTFSADGVLTRKDSLPFILNTFTLTGNTITGQTLERQLSRAARPESVNSFVDRTDLRTNIDAANVAPNGSYALIIENGDPDQIARILNIETNQLVLDIGQIRETSSVWAPDSTQLFVTGAGSDSEKSIGIVRINPLTKERVEILRKEDAPAPEGRLVAANGQQFFMFDEDNDVTYLVSEQDNPLPVSYKELNNLLVDGISITYNTAQGYILVTQNNPEMSQQLVRETAVRILRENGFNTEAAEIIYSFDTGLRRVDEFIPE